MGKNVSSTQKKGKKLCQISRFRVPKNFFKNILKVLKRINRPFFLQEWVKMWVVHKKRVKNLNGERAIKQGI